jgi:hypothetical protein
MSRVASGVLVAALATFAFGAVHLAGASGNSQRILIKVSDASPSPAVRMVSIVNRDTKSDRAGVPVQDRSTTVSFKSPSLPGTSFIVRVPDGTAAVTAPEKDVTRSAPKRMTACEPSVSVLTAIAKQLQPSRCVT